MKLVSYTRKAAPEQSWRAGIWLEQGIIDVQEALADAPATMMGLLADWKHWYERLQALQQPDGMQTTAWKQFKPLEDVVLGSPLPRPNSFRDFYAFEAHVKTAREKRGLSMVPEWYHFPVFYFSNANAFLGPDEPVRRPKATSWLDYELEVACVIGKGGVDIPVQAADQHIAGFCILNDWSARDVQREEVKVGLGPAKGKDFATSMGPWLVTPDELADRLLPSEKGARYDLSMVARVNGVEYSRGNLGDLYYTFAEMIARASADCPLYPGDVIGSGTVGTGCILELGSEQYPWLQPGDVVELQVDGLGVLRSRIVEAG
ncbi:fumarylacetoacetate hydrolase family protein [Brevibacillus migulae]|uniref:fumarylacetoacetate hydrolase family protein n=1 Tax=Brevibacillus migulae TaxID=1644114 RepID=UPI00106DFB2D|nr:fumarylacetoacetate hydrolase family protein [Brevibacillus migulae]